MVTSESGMSGSVLNRSNIFTFDSIFMKYSL